MSNEKHYIFDSYNGKEPWDEIHEEIYPDQECNVCYGELACVLTSIKLSTNMWPPPEGDPYTYIGKNCIKNYTTINFKFIAHSILVKIIGKNLSNIINEYL